MEPVKKCEVQKGKKYTEESDPCSKEISWQLTAHEPDSACRVMNLAAFSGRKALLALHHSQVMGRSTKRQPAPSASLLQSSVIMAAAARKILLTSRHDCQLSINLHRFHKNKDKNINL